MAVAAPLPRGRGGQSKKLCSLFWMYSEKAHGLKLNLFFVLSKPPRR